MEWLLLRGFKELNTWSTDNSGKAGRREEKRPWMEGLFLCGPEKDNARRTRDLDEVPSPWAWVIWLFLGSGVPADGRGSDNLDEIPSERAGMKWLLLRGRERPHHACWRDVRKGGIESKDRLVGAFLNCK
jgi:hypothetical protein